MLCSSKLHIPPTNYRLLVAHQELYKKSLTLNGGGGGGGRSRESELEYSRIVALGPFVPVIQSLKLGPNERERGERERERETHTHTHTHTHNTHTNTHTYPFKDCS